MGNLTFEDYHEITSVIFRYKLALDTGDWKAMQESFAPEVELDTSGGLSAAPPGARAPFGAGTRRVNSADYVWDVKVLNSGFDAVQHIFANPLVNVDGDDAEVVGQFYGEHVAATSDGDPWFTEGGYQTIRLRRIGGSWRITGLALHALWMRGNKDVMSLAVARGVRRLVDAGDPPPARILEAHGIRAGDGEP